MFPYGPPDDLEEFWREAVIEADRLHLNLDRSAFPVLEEANHLVSTYSFDGAGGFRVHGWVAVPKEQHRGCPAFLWVPPYGRESVLPNSYGTRKGYVSASLNFHGLDPFHQEAYSPIRGYFAEGAEEPRSWKFRAMFQDAALAVRALRTFVEIDEERIASAGMSQGGGISIWLGAWCPHVKLVCADMPFLGKMGRTLGRPSYRYPQKELVEFAERLPMGMERLLFTLSYFDTSHQARYCRVPTQISFGERDPAVLPKTAEAIYDALPGQKRLISYPGGHDWDVHMIENNLSWMNQYFYG